MPGTLTPRQADKRGAAEAAKSQQEAQARTQANARVTTPPLCVVRVGGDDGELRPWHYIYICVVPCPGHGTLQVDSRLLYFLTSVTPTRVDLKGSHYTPFRPRACLPVLCLRISTCGLSSQNPLTSAVWLDDERTACALCEDRVLDGPASGGKGSKGIN